MQIFTDQSFNMAFIIWNVLLSYFVSGTAHPVLGKYAEIAINQIVLLNLSGQLTEIAIPLVPHLYLFEHSFVTAPVSEDFSLNLALGSSKSIDFGRDMASIAWHIVFGEVGGSCKFSHDNNN
jgi:hypothetical protein